MKTFAVRLAAATAAVVVSIGTHQNPAHAAPLAVTPAAPIILPASPQADPAAEVPYSDSDRSTATSRSAAVRVPRTGARLTPDTPRRGSPQTEAVEIATPSGPQPAAAVIIPVILAAAKVWAIRTAAVSGARVVLAGKTVGTFVYKAGRIVGVQVGNAYRACNTSKQCKEIAMEVAFNAPDIGKWVIDRCREAKVCPR